MKPQDFSRQAPGTIQQTPQGYWTFVPASLPPDITWSTDMIEVLSRADRALGELAGIGSDLPNPNLLVRPFMRREAVLSSRIEGTLASLADLYTFEAAQLPLFEIPSDVAEVHNYVRAMEYGLERLQTFPMSLRLIRDIHEHLMAGVRGEHWTPGEFRRSQNWIGPPGSTIETATFVPPPVDEMQMAMNELEEFIHKPSQIPPLIRLSLIHYQFEAIHPFLDGNGRIGRLLTSLLLCSWNLLPRPLLYLSAYFETERDNYYDTLLKVSQNGDWEKWIIYFLTGVSIQAKDAVFRIRRLHDLLADYRNLCQSSRSTARILQVVDLLFEQPVLTVQQVADAIEVHYPAAKRYVEQLEEFEILREITGNARNRVYRADAILEAVSAPINIENETI